MFQPLATCLTVPASPATSPSRASVALEQPLRLVSQRDIDRLQLRQVKLPDLRLLGNRQLLIQRLCRVSGLLQRAIHLLDHSRLQHAVEVANPDRATIQTLQQLLDRTRSQRALNRRLELRKPPLLLN